MGVTHDLNRVYAVTVAVLFAIAVILSVALLPLTG